MSILRSYQTPAADRAAVLFDTAEASRRTDGHLRENLRFACKREAGGETGILGKIIDYYFPEGQRAGLLDHYMRLVRSAQREPGEPS